MYNIAMSSPTFDEEEKLWQKGFEYVIGVDEVGRGSFAGPVTAAAVAFKRNEKKALALGINDSKVLKPLERRKISTLIQSGCFSYSIATIPVSIINKVGIGKASQIAFRKAIGEVIEKLRNEDTMPSKSKDDRDSDVLISQYSNIFLLADGFHIKFVKGIGIKNQKAIIKGDRISISIAAASVIAKVHRDSLMRRLGKDYPKYGFGRNKGYGTALHRKALKKHGLTKIHRTSFNLSRYLSG